MDIIGAATLKALLVAAAFKNVGVVRYVSHLLGDRAVISGCDASDALEG